VLRQSFEIDLIEIVLCGSSPGFSFYCEKREKREKGGRNEEGKDRWKGRKITRKSYGEREGEGEREREKEREKERERERGREWERERESCLMKLLSSSLCLA
jgi:hypothetical protein